MVSVQALKAWWGSVKYRRYLYKHGTRVECLRYLAK
jgi:hypothetical protein